MFYKGTHICAHKLCSLWRVFIVAEICPSAQQGRREAPPRFSYTHTKITTSTTKAAADSSALMKQRQMVVPHNETLFTFGSRAEKDLCSLPLFSLNDWFTNASKRIEWERLWSSLKLAPFSALWLSGPSREWAHPPSPDLLTEQPVQHHFPPSEDFRDQAQTSSVQISRWQFCTVVKSFHHADYTYTQACFFPPTFFDRRSTKLALNFLQSISRVGSPGKSQYKPYTVASHNLPSRSTKLPLNILDSDVH